MKRVFLLTVMFMLAASVMAQTTFVQTTTDDFLKGSGSGVVISDGSVSLQGKMESINDWTSTTNLPLAMEGHQMALCRNYVYLVGGANGTAVLNNVYVATQQANGISGWTTLNPLPVPLRDMAVVASQTHLYVMGGRNSEGLSDKIYSALINDDGTIGEWTELTITLASACWGARAVMALDFIFLVGGATADNENSVSRNVYRFSVNAFGEITGMITAASLPQARNGHAVAVYDSKIIVTGGYDASHTPTNTVYTSEISLKGILGSWQTQTALPTALYDHNMVVTNGIICVFGGNDGNLPCNALYITDANLSQFSWSLSDIMLIERNTKAASFVFGEKIFYSGGESLSGSINNYIRYAKVNASSQMVNNSIFISKPFYIGTPKMMQQLEYSLNVADPSTSYELLYRTAGSNGNYNTWTSVSTNNPLTLNQTKSHIQYMFRFTATGSANVSLDDVTLTVTGYTPLAGNLDGLETLTLAGSPYWVTDNISFTSGTHTIEAGVTLLFSPDKGLNIGRANVHFNGTATQPITLTYQGTESGLWNGVCFEDYSDNGVSSTMTYTVIEKAGNGDNNANLRLDYTNSPTISHCTFNDADGHGVRLWYSSPTMTDVTMSGNSECGLYLYASAPNCSTGTMSGNGYGIYWASANFDASLSGITLSDNTYGLYSCSPDRSFTYNDTDVAISNNDIDIALGGGRISEDRSWNYYANGYALFGNLEIYGGTPKLSLAAGNTVKVNQGYGIYVGSYGDQGGMLYAVANQANPITFTSFNGEIGGWEGLKFRDGSDYNSSSSLRYCVVEKANTNVWSQNTTQPSIMYCTLQDAVNSNIELNSSDITVESSDIKNAKKGMYLNNSKPTLILDIFDNLSEACVWQENVMANDVTYYSCTMKNSNYGIRYWTPNQDIATQTQVTFQNNFADQVIPGGEVNEDHVWGANTFYFPSTIMVGRYCELCRLTLSPGCTLKFGEGTGMEISNNWSSYGELNAIGTATNPITFTSSNGESGGWNGLYFVNANYYTSAIESVLKYCVFENGNEYNVQVYYSEQLSLIEHCTFKNSTGYGLFFRDCGGTITVKDCQFQNNASYAVYCNSPHHVGSYINNTFTGNLKDGVAMGGGDITENRTWNSLGEYAYYILSTIRIGRDEGTCRLTLSPGCVLKFAEGTKMEVSCTQNGHPYHNFYGELNAVGTSSNPITFTSMNGEIGGWNGLYFDYRSDDIEGQESVLNYCVFENGNEYNVQVYNTEQPSLIENCIFRNSAGYGLYFCNGGSGVTTSNCSFYNNANYAVYYNAPVFVGAFNGNIFSGNLSDGVATGGGDITENRTWNALGDYAYYILSTIRIGRDGEACRLTLSPGCVLKFAEGTKMEVSCTQNGHPYHSFYGELNAVGNSSNPITFTSMNGESGGWNGLYFDFRSDDIAGMESVMKYCIVEKGNEYNLRVDDSNQPYLVEHCKLINSNGRGLWLNNSSITVNKSLIRDNASYGIYLSGNSAPVIGGNMMRGCDILNNNNGSFAIYQDGGQNVSMAYNYFGTFDAKDVDDNLVFDKMEDNNKGRIDVYPVSETPRSVPSLPMNGHLYYDNSSAMGSATVAVKDFHGETLAQTTTSSSGYFDLGEVDLDVAAKIVITPANSMNGVNSTDALQVMRHFAHLINLTEAHRKAADVNGSYTVNGTDALFIQRWYANTISDFPVGSSYLKIEDMDFDDEELDMRINFLWYGDVNGSGTGSRGGEVLLQNEGEMIVASGQEVNIPVRIDEALDMGATSLRFTYPEEFIEIESVDFATNEGSFVYHAEDGELHISWYDLEPLSLENGSVMFHIVMNTKDLSGLNEPITFSVGYNSEIADSEGDVMENVTLLMPSLVTEILAVAENKVDEDMCLTAYPNPMKDQMKISYYLKSEETVTMTVYNTNGNVVARLVNGLQESGQHEVVFSRYSLVAGVYYCHLVLGDTVKVIKLIVE